MHKFDVKIHKTPLARLHMSRRIQLGGIVGQGASVRNTGYNSFFSKTDVVKNTSSVSRENLDALLLSANCVVGLADKVSSFKNMPYLYRTWMYTVQYSNTVHMHYALCLSKLSKFLMYEVVVNQYTYLLMPWSKTKISSLGQHLGTQNSG